METKTEFLLEKRSFLVNAELDVSAILRNDPELIFSTAEQSLISIMSFES